MSVNSKARTVGLRVSCLSIIVLLMCLLVACGSNGGTNSPDGVLPVSTKAAIRHPDCSATAPTSNKTLFVLSISSVSSSNGGKPTFTLRALDLSGKKLWEQSLGQGDQGGSYAAVQAASGKVYVSLYDESTLLHDTKRTLTALDAKDGHQLWKVEEDEEMSTFFNTAPMQLCGDTLYLWSRNSIEARDSENGQRVWRHTIAQLHLHSIQEVRATSRGVIIDGISGSDQTNHCPDNRFCYNFYGDTVLALNSSTGQQIWQHTFTPDSHSDPHTYAQEGIAGIAVTEQAVYLNDAFLKKANEIQALEMGGGKPLWKIQGRTDEHAFLHRMKASPTALVLQAEKTLATYKGSDGSLLWQKHDGVLLLETEEAVYLQQRDPQTSRWLLCADGLTSGNQRWCVPSPALNQNYIALAQNQLVFTFDNRQVNATSSSDGKLSWSYQLGAQEAEETFRSAALG